MSSIVLLSPHDTFSQPMYFFSAASIRCPWRGYPTNKILLGGRSLKPPYLQVSDLFSIVHIFTRAVTDHTSICLVRHRELGAYHMTRLVYFFGSPAWATSLRQFEIVGNIYWVSRKILVNYSSLSLTLTEISWG